MTIVNKNYKDNNDDGNTSSTTNGLNILATNICARKEGQVTCRTSHCCASALQKLTLP